MEWQTILTAPKDKPVLLYSEEDQIGVGRFSYTSEKYGDFWEIGDDPHAKALLWCPIPELPKRES